MRTRTRYEAARRSRYSSGRKSAIIPRSGIQESQGQEVGGNSTEAIHVTVVYLEPTRESRNCMTHPRDDKFPMTSRARARSLDRFAASRIDKRVLRYAFPRCIALACRPRPPRLLGNLYKIYAPMIGRIVREIDPPFDARIDTGEIGAADDYAARRILARVRPFHTDGIELNRLRLIRDDCSSSPTPPLPVFPSLSHAGNK